MALDDAQAVYCCVCGARKGRKGKDLREWRKAPETLLIGGTRTRNSRQSANRASEICSSCRRSNARVQEHVKLALEQSAGRKTRGQATKGCNDVKKQSSHRGSKVDQSIAEHQNRNVHVSDASELERPKKRLRFENSGSCSAEGVLKIVTRVTRARHDQLENEQREDTRSCQALEIREVETDTEMLESLETSSAELLEGVLHNVGATEASQQQVPAVPTESTVSKTPMNPLKSHVNYGKRSHKEMVEIAKLLQKQCKEIGRRLKRAVDARQRAEGKETELKEWLSEITKYSDLEAIRRIFEAKQLLATAGRLDVFDELADAVLSERLPLSHLIFQRLETSLRNLKQSSTNLHRYSDLEMSYWSVVASLQSGVAVIEFMRGLGHGGHGQRQAHATDISKINEFVPTLTAICKYDTKLDEKAAGPDNLSSCETGLGVSNSRIREAATSQPTNTKDVFLGFDYTDVKESLKVSQAHKFFGDHDLSGTPIADGYDPKELEEKYTAAVVPAEKYLLNVRQMTCGADSVDLKPSFLLKEGVEVLDAFSAFVEQQTGKFKADLKEVEQKQKQRSLEYTRRQLRRRGNPSEQAVTAPPVSDGVEGGAGRVFGQGLNPQQFVELDKLYLDFDKLGRLASSSADLVQSVSGHKEGVECLQEHDRLSTPRQRHGKVFYSGVRGDVGPSGRREGKLRACRSESRGGRG
jgi:hypothetical protein